MKEIEIAKGISEFGMLAVTAGFFLFFSATMMIIFVRWFVKMINGMIDGQSKITGQLLDETKKQNEGLNDIREGLIMETDARVKVIASLAFDLSVEAVCGIVKKIREEDCISDVESTESKIRALLQNMHDSRNAKFDNFKFRGRRLSEYANPEWVSWLMEIVKHEVYHENPNNRRMYSNVQIAYERIKIDFYKRLNYDNKQTF